MARKAAMVMALVTSMLATSALADETDEIRARDDRIEDLERKLDVVVDELARMRTQVAVPDEPELTSLYGLGPAASKIYGIERGLSIGGYGEARYTNYINDSHSENDPGLNDKRKLSRSDFLRLVLYLGYKFTDSIVFNSEIEFEHATAGEGTATSESGAVSVEFATLDFFWKSWMNARAGLLLLPMGFLNEVHEPPFYYGVHRPETERRILPSTWRENGVGIFGRLGENLEYRAYTVTGFNARGFSDEGIRDGRQDGNEALAEDLAFVGRLDWTPLPGLLLGGSLYVGDSGQSQETGGVEIPDARLTTWELHGQYDEGPFHARTLFAMSHLSNAGDLTNALGLSSPVADEMLGGYAEVAYDVWPGLFGEADRSLSPFVRVEYVDTQYDVPSGFTPNRNEAFWLFTPGLSFKPTPNVVLKLEYRNFFARSGEIPDEFSLGMGFAF